MTLEQYAETVLRPATLKMLGLPDTEEANDLLDDIVASLIAQDSR